MLDYNLKEDMGTCCLKCEIKEYDIDLLEMNKAQSKKKQKTKRKH